MKEISMNSCDLTILMPCLNEAETLGRCIDMANTWISHSNLKVEILIADNGSSDGSQDIARSLGARVVDVPVKGYGSALFYGSKAAYGKWIIMGDSDCSYDFSSIDDFVAKLSDGYDLVMGNRFLGGIKEGAMPWKNRYIGNPILSFIGRTLFNCPAGDFHCGLRGYSKCAFEKMDLRTTGMEYASEMVIKANILEMAIAEVPTTLSPDGRSRPPHLKPWRDGWRHLRFMLLFSPKWLFFIPGLVLFGFGMAVSAMLGTGSIDIGNVKFGVNTLVYALSIALLGYLMICTSLTVRIVGVIDGILPDRNYLSKIRSKPILEWGSVIGLFISIFGTLVVANQFISWGSMSYGEMQSLDFLKITILSGFAIIFGFVTFVYSMMIGFLSLPTRRAT